MAKWSDTNNIRFVQELLKHECLFNIKSPNLKNKMMRDAAMLSISQAMEMPGFGAKEVYAKLRSIKSTYYQEKKKFKDSCRSGAGAMDVYTSNIKWFQLKDEAFNAVNGECRGSQSNLQNTPHIFEEYNNENAPRVELSTPDQIGHMITNSGNADECGESGNAENPKRNTPTRKRTLRQLDNIVTKARLVADVIGNSGTSSNLSETEFDVFGKSIAAQLNNMPLNAAIQAQMCIQNYLSHLRLQQMSTSSSTRLFDSHSSPISPNLFITPTQRTPSPNFYISSTPPQPTPSPNSNVTSQPTPSPTFYISSTPPQPTPSPNSNITSQPTPSPNSYKLASQTQPTPSSIYVSDSENIITLYAPDDSDTDGDILSRALKSIKD